MFIFLFIANCYTEFIISLGFRSYILFQLICDKTQGRAKFFAVRALFLAVNLPFETVLKFEVRHLN